MQKDNTKRFSNRVDDYVRYRPHYPKGIITFLQREYGLDSKDAIADIGAGTGISTSLFLNAGYQVTAVEPNKEMRQKARELLGNFAGFRVMDGTAENTGIETHTVDAVVAGQAFHWFDPEKCKIEFTRILKPEGIIVLIWNERKTESPFEQEYDKLIIEHGRDYVKVDHRNIDDEHISKFFYPKPVQLKIFRNKQEFDFEGLKGRLLSSSYMPARNEKGYTEMIKDLKDLFERYKHNGLIRINYDTKVYCGK